MRIATTQYRGLTSPRSARQPQNRATSPGMDTELRSLLRNPPVLWPAMGHAPDADAAATDAAQGKPTGAEVSAAADTFAPGTPSVSSAELLHSPSSTSDEEEQLEPSKRFAGKTILIISGGTRGDVQPAAALGVALAGEGAHVRLAADPSFKGFVEPLGLEFYPLGGSAREMMALTVKWGGMLPTEMSGMFWLRSQIKEVMHSVWCAATDDEPPETQCCATAQPDSTDGSNPAITIGTSSSSSTTSCSSSHDDQSTFAARSSSCHSRFRPDLILANQLAYGQVHVAEKLGIPLHVLLTIPWLPTQHIAHPWARAFDKNVTEWAQDAAEALLAPVCGLVGLFKPSWALRLRHWVLSGVTAAANRFSTPLLDHTAWFGIADIHAGFRRKLGLPLLSANNLGNALYRYSTTCLFSPQLVPKPDDWPSHVTLSGFLSLTDALSRYRGNTPDALCGADSTAGSCSSSVTGHGGDGGMPDALAAAADSSRCSQHRAYLQRDGLAVSPSSAQTAAETAAQAVWPAAASAGDCQEEGLVDDKVSLTEAGCLQQLTSAYSSSTAPNSTTISTAAGRSRSSSSSSSSTGRGSSTSSAGLAKVPSSYTPPADLQAFLEGGPPPIYIGFGSMVVDDARQLMQLVLQAVQMLQDSSSETVRVLVCTGWAAAAAHTAVETEAAATDQQRHTQQHCRQPDMLLGQQTNQPSQWVGPSGPACRSSASASWSAVGEGSTASLADRRRSPEVFFASEVPHEWLFPRCSVLVHHGGVGTTAVGLRNGKPTLVVAAFGDLFFWGDMCHALGVGPPVLFLKGLTAPRLFTAMYRLLQEHTYSQAAQQVAENLQEEDGLSAALQAVALRRRLSPPLRG